MVQTAEYLFLATKRQAIMDTNALSANAKIILQQKASFLNTMHAMVTSWYLFAKVT
jgi:hypothetical protein